MKVTTDPSVNVGYIYLTQIKNGEAVEQVKINNKPIILDFNKNGQLLGIEFLDISKMPPNTRRKAK